MEPAPALFPDDHVPGTPPGPGAMPRRALKEMNGGPRVAARMAGTNAGSPKGREPYGDTGLVVVVRVTPHQGGREAARGRRGPGDEDIHGLGVCVMQSAEAASWTSCVHAAGGACRADELYRQLFNPALFLMAWGRIYANDGAMTPGACGETADGMSLAKIGQIHRCAAPRALPVPASHGLHPRRRAAQMRPLSLPSWSDKLVGEVVRILLEASYEPRFSGRSHGFRPGRGCHTALAEVAAHLDRDNLVYRGRYLRLLREPGPFSAPGDSRGKDP